MEFQGYNLLGLNTKGGVPERPWFAVERDLTLHFYSEQTAPRPVVFEEMARLYAENQYVDSNGLVNPFDNRYLKGGGHFCRDTAWFESMLQREGARLLVASDSSGVVTGYSLFFTNPETFPAFAAECLRYRHIPGVEKFAYTYLLIVDEAVRRLGLATQIFEAELKICGAEDCDFVAHELFMAPVPNAASLGWHAALAKTKGAFFPGICASHIIERAAGGEPAQVQYCHVLIPTAGRGFCADEVGQLRFSRNGRLYAPISRRALEHGGGCKAEA